MTHRPSSRPLARPKESLRRVLRRASLPSLRPLVGGVALLATLGTLQAQQRVTALDGQALDWFGYDCAMSGDYAVVGSWRDDDAGANTGSAHVIYAPGTGVPAYLQKLTLEDMAAGDLTGMTVAIGGGVIALSVPGREIVRANGDVVTGTVAVFEETAGVWSATALLDAPSRTDGDLFGAGIAVAGDQILVGAPRDDGYAPDGGALFVFERSGAGWSMIQKLGPVGIGTHDYFGHDVCAAGDLATVTAYNDDEQGTNAGAAYTLKRVHGTWEVTQKLVGSEGASFDLFGTCVAMTEEAIVVGAPQNEDTDSAAAANEGCAFVYEWSSHEQAWVETGCLRPGKPNDDHRFGIDVAINDHVVIVGASHSETNLLNSGSAHVFGRRGRDCFETSNYVALVPQAYDYLGLSVAAGENAVMVGVPGANEGAVGTGAVDVLDAHGNPDVWGSTFCHSRERVGGFRNMGGEMNSTDQLGRLMCVGSNSVARGDLILRGTNLPENALATLIMGGGTTKRRLGEGRICVSGDQLGGYQFAFQGIGPDGRYVVRDPIGRIAQVYPSATPAMIGRSMYAQVVYFDRSMGVWNTTNALRIRLTK